LYLPAAQFQMTATNLVARTTASPEVLTSIARDRIRAIDPDVRVMAVVPFREMLGRPLSRPRFIAWLFGLFAIVALGLSAVGLHAVLAADVRQRDREMALRIALGATATSIRWLVLRETMLLAGVGMAIGAAGMLASTHLLEEMLFEVHALDLPVLIGAGLALLGVCALGSYVPVRRATRLDAVVMLRNTP
jgi:ABC-type lipoprotein release transport system permease subunit